MDSIIKKQIELEKLLETTSNSSKKIYSMQLKVWINGYINGYVNSYINGYINGYVNGNMSHKNVSNLLDQRIKELKK